MERVLANQAAAEEAYRVNQIRAMLAQLGKQQRQGSGRVKTAIIESDGGNVGTFEQWLVANLYNGGVMLPASYYDYSQKEIKGKLGDDLKYIFGGIGGTVFSRFLDIF